MTVTDKDRAIIKAVIEDHTPDGNPCDCCNQQGCNGTGCVHQSTTVYWSPGHVWAQVVEALDAADPKYKIVRYFADDKVPSKVIRRRVTLAQAQEHCSDEATHGDGWFDGYTEDRL